MTTLMSYDAASMSTMTAINVPVTASTVISVSGSHMSQVDGSPRARLSRTACEASEWRSASSLLCVSGAGAGGSRRAVVSVGLQIGSASAVASYDAMMSVYINTTNVAATAFALVTISGNNMGTQDLSFRSRVGGSAAVRGSWTSDSAVISLVAAGARGTRRVHTSLACASGTTSGILSYDMAVVNGSAPKNIPTTGSSSISIHGGGWV